MPTNEDSDPRADVPSQATRQPKASIGSWWFYKKLLADGRVVYAYPMTYGKARVGVSVDEIVGYFEDEWCYSTPALAERAIDAWDGEGEPTGWMRHPRTGRRRPDGDPSKEYVNP